MSDRPLQSSARVTIALGADGPSLADAISRAGLLASVFSDAADAAAAWMRGDEPVPEAALLLVCDPDLPRATDLLQARGDVPVLVGVYPEGSIADAVGLLRAGFYDCVPSPLSCGDAVEVVREGLAERDRFRASRGDLAVPMEDIIALAAERDLRQAGERVARLLANHAGGGTCSVVAGGLAFPGGEPYAPPPELWHALGTGEPMVLEGAALPSGLRGAAAEASLLAPGVLLVRAGEGLPPPHEDARLAGGLLSLVSELSTLRESMRAPSASKPIEGGAAILSTLLRVHHDINNPLCAIALHAQLLGMELGASGNPKTLERLRSIQENARKIEQIVNRLADAKRALSVNT